MFCINDQYIFLFENVRNKMYVRYTDYQTFTTVMVGDNGRVL